MRKIKGLFGIVIGLIVIQFLPNWIGNIIGWLILLLALLVVVDVIRLRTANIGIINSSKLNNILKDVFKDYPNVKINVEALPKGEIADTISLFTDDIHNYTVQVDNNRYISEVLIKGIRDLKILFSLEEKVVNKINDKENINVNFDIGYYIKKSMFSNKLDS